MEFTTKKFTFNDWQEIGQLFSDMFSTSSLNFITIEMLAIYKRPAIDIFKFEEWLYEKYPSDIDLSIHDIVLKHYGEKGVELIQKLL